jgi:hypothetical protein
MAGCGGGTAAPACRDNGDCGENQACIVDLGICQDVDCLDSSSCGRREYCDETTFVCRAGCAEDSDCDAGEACNLVSNTCEPYGCRDTELDCSIGETCNEVTGECVRDPRGHCDLCTPDFWTPAGSCRDSGAFCLYVDEAAIDAYCLLECAAATDCPRGYQCVDAGSDFDGDGRSDSICYAYCPVLYDLGWK